MAYEIAVACDVKLGEMFRQNPDISEINIDPVAIAESVDRLVSLRAESPITSEANDEEPEPLKQLLFIASHNDSLVNLKDSKNNLRLGHFEHTYEAPRLESRFIKVPLINPGKKISMCPTTVIRVNVFGAAFKLARMNSGELRSYVNTIRNAEENVSVEKEKIIIEQIATDTEPVARIMPEPASSVQNIAVHELSHSADFLINDEILEQDKRHNKKFYSNKFFGRTATFLGASALLVMTEQSTLFDAVNTHPAIFTAGNFVLQIIGANVLFKTNDAKVFNNYLSLPSEVRARSTENSSGEYPQIIDII